MHRACKSPTQLPQAGFPFFPAQFPRGHLGHLQKWARLPPGLQEAALPAPSRPRGGPKLHPCPRPAPPQLQPPRSFRPARWGVAGPGPGVSPRPVFPPSGRPPASKPPALQNPDPPRCKPSKGTAWVARPALAPPLPPGTALPPRPPGRTRPGSRARPLSCRGAPPSPAWNAAGRRGRRGHGLGLSRAPSGRWQHQAGAGLAPGEACHQPKGPGGLTLEPLSLREGSRFVRSCTPP